MQSHSISDFTVSESEKECVPRPKVETEVPYGAPLNIPTDCKVDSKGINPPCVSFTDRKSNAEAMLLSFIAEHSLPLSMSPHLINLAKELGRDQRALDSVSMERQTATYKLVYGLGAALTKRTVNDLKQTSFSINLDECTSSNNLKILSVLVSYFSDHQKECVVKHLASINMTVVNAETIYNAIIELLQSNDIPLENLVSSLSDSANYMRGKVSGFETRLREKVPHLLDIDGDICHHVHNVVKKFCYHFDHILESLADDLHTDFKYSPDLREFLEEICKLLKVTYHKPPQRVAHRWLSCYDVVSTIEDMLDPLTVFYYSWVSDKDKYLYKNVFLDIVKRVPKKSQRKRIYEICGILKRKSLTKEGKERKLRVVEKLYIKRETSLVYMSIYGSVLPMFKSFVLTFEQKEPMVHRLFVEQVELTKTFFSCFLRHEAVRELSWKKLTKLDLKNEDTHLPLYQIYVGADAEKVLVSMDATEVKVVYHKLMYAYIDAGEYIQKKFPLNNRTLRYLQSIDPEYQGNSQTHGGLKHLKEYFPTVFKGDDDQFLQEISRLQLDMSLPNFEEKSRIDKWWAQVFSTNKYPVVSKLVKAALSIFTGPRVESSFSEMNDIINSKSNRMLTQTYAAL